MLYCGALTYEKMILQDPWATVPPFTFFFVKIWAKSSPQLLCFQLHGELLLQAPLTVGDGRLFQRQSWGTDSTTDFRLPAPPCKRELEIDISPRLQSFCSNIFQVWLCAGHVGLAWLQAVLALVIRAHENCLDQCWRHGILYVKTGIGISCCSCRLFLDLSIHPIGTQQQGTTVQGTTVQGTTKILQRYYKGTI